MEETGEVVSYDISAEAVDRLVGGSITCQSREEYPPFVAVPMGNVLVYLERQDAYAWKKPFV